MQNPKDYRRYAEECERIARSASPEHQETLLKIARAWRECALNAEKRNSDQPSSVDVIDRKRRFRDAGTALRFAGTPAPANRPTCVNALTSRRVNVFHTRSRVHTEPNFSLCLASSPSRGCPPHGFSPRKDPLRA